MSDELIPGIVDLYVRTVGLGTVVCYDFLTLEPSSYTRDFVSGHHRSSHTMQADNTIQSSMQEEIMDLSAEVRHLQGELTKTRTQFGQILVLVMEMRDKQAKTDATTEDLTYRAEWGENFLVGLQDLLELYRKETRADQAGEVNAGGEVEEVDEEAQEAQEAAIMKSILGY